MSVLSTQFNKELSHDSPYVPDYRRVSNFDKDGVEVVTYVEKDAPSVVKSHGKVDDWSLTYLLKAGIDPNSLHVSTTAPTGLESFNDISAWNAAIDSVLEDSNDK